MNPSNPQNLIVLVVDRLGCGFCGPYGNTWLETPAANRLAAEALLVDFAITDSVDLSQVYTSYWTGSHAVDRRRSVPTPASWLDRLPGSGVSTWLLTDEELVAYHPLAGQFQHRAYHPFDDATESVQVPEKSAMMRSFAGWMARLETLRPPFLAWIHARGMQGAWDAPFAYRTQIADPEDPAPPTAVDVPADDARGQVADPERLWGLTCAYGAQVVLLDECLDMFLRFLETQAWGQDTTLLFTSPRGFPLGEHGVVGDAAECLFSESVHVPLMVRGPLVAGGRPGSMQRVAGLAQPCDIGRWIAHGHPWLAGPHDACRTFAEILERSDGAARAAVIGTEQICVRTPQWCYIGSLCGPDKSAGQLFVKPDDRWDFNDIAQRAPDGLQEMQTLAEDLLMR